MFDRKTFFREIRKSLFRDGMGQSQVDGLNRLLDMWVAYFVQSNPIGFLAYGLATSYHETGRKMQPVRELGGKAYLTSNYDITGRNPSRARKHGNINPGDGVRYSGRGDTQLTWKDNYGRATAMLRNFSPDFAGVDLVANPDKALDPKISAVLLFEGSIIGLYTGRKLGDYIKPGMPPDYRGARWVINGQDDAELIASYARAFEAALVAAARAWTGEQAPAATPIQPDDNDAPAPAQPGEPDTGDGKAWSQSSTILSAIASAGATVIAAINTPWGVAALGIIAVSGVATAWIIRERLVKAKEWGV